MIAYSIIQKTQLEGANRLDAEYYQPEYLTIGQTLFKSPKLSEVSKKITDFGAYSQMNFVNFVDSGTRFFRNQDVGEFLINDSDPIYITNEVYSKLSLKLDEFDILTPRVGTVGNSVVLFEDNLPASANQNLAQIKADFSKIDPVYLSIFLCSNYGRSQFERAATGNVQPWLNLQQIKSLRVFVPSNEQQKKIRGIALESRRIYKNSLNLYKQAENLLLEELGLSDFQIPNDLSYIVDYSDTEKVERIDADFFQPKYEQLISKLKRNNAKPLGSLVSIKKGFEPGGETYLDGGKIFIRVSSLSKNGLEDKDQKYLSEELYQKLKSDYEPKMGEILVTKDASPGIAYVIKEPIEGIISGGVVRLKLKTDLETEYLSLCVNSMIGKMQVERDAGGSIIVHWKPEQIRNILIPVLPKETQKIIADLVRKSHEARKKSKELLEKAKRKVEDMIEKGGVKNGKSS